MLFEESKNEDIKTQKIPLGKFLGGLLVSIFFILIVIQVYSEFSSAIKLFAACSSWTSGDDTGVCSDTNGSQDFGTGSDELTNNGSIIGDSNDVIVHADFSGTGNDYGAVVWVNGGNSNDNTVEIINNNGIIRGNPNAISFMDTGAIGFNSVNLIMFENKNGSKILNNTGTIRNQGEGYSIMADSGAGNAKLEIDNSGSIDKVGTNTEIIYSSGFSIDNSGRIGLSSAPRGTGIYGYNASSTLNNLAGGLIYSGVSFSSRSDTFINRGTIDVNSISMFGGNDLFLTNLTTGSVSISGSLDAGAGTDRFVAEVDSGREEDFAKFGTGFEEYLFTGGGLANLITTYSFSEDVIVDTDTTLSASSNVNLSGDLDLNEDVDGNIKITINSDTPEVTSKFNVDGTAYLAGTLYVEDDGSSLSEGDEFIILEAGTISGTFSSVDLPSLTSGLSWSTDYAGDKVTISVVSGPVVSEIPVTVVNSGRTPTGLRKRTEKQKEDTSMEDMSTTIEDNNGGIFKSSGSSCPTFRSYLSIGKLNDEFEVKKWQVFLSSFVNSKLSYNGFFDKSTESATKDFQFKYSDQVLKPWGLTNPTGLVYKTTRSFANYLTNCPEREIELEGVGVFRHGG